MDQTLVQQIREKAARLKQLDAEATRLRLELADIHRLLGDVVAAQPHAGPRKPTRRGNSGREKDHGRPIRQGSNIAAAMQVLTAAGHDMHVDMMLPEVEKIVGRPVSKATLVGQLSEYVRKELIFTRPSPSTFGLASGTNGIGANGKSPKAEAAV